MWVGGKGGGGGEVYILLLVRILSASALPLVCTLSPKPMSGLLIKIAQTHYWDGGKKWLGVGYLDLIFKVTPAL